MKQAISEFRQALADDGPILAGVMLVAAGLLILLALNGVNGLGLRSYANNLFLYLFNLGVLVIFLVGGRLYRERPDSPIGYLVRLAARLGWLRRAARGIPVLLALIVFTPVFSAIKSAIPMFSAYSWDPVWISADQAIHGTDAWRFLQPLIGFPVVTSFLSYAYHAWFFVMYAGSMYFCFLTNDRELRARYFIVFFATWTVLGIALATGWASVGPCFLAPLTGDHQFDEQMAYLRAANEQYPVLVLPVQEMLLSRYLDSNHELASGISAMPSMHVSMALLFALGIAKVSKRAGIAAYLFLLIIMIGSVHLAYHYAVDGYVSIVVTIAIWALAKPLARMVVTRRGSGRDLRPPPLQPGAVAT